MAEQGAAGSGEAPIRPGVVASLCVQWVKNRRFRQRVQEDLNEALREYGYLDELFPAELEVVREFIGDTLGRGLTPEEVDDMLIGEIRSEETGGVSHFS